MKTKSASLTPARILTATILALLLHACGGRNGAQTLDDCPVVAHTDKDGVVVCDYVSVRDTVNIPMSSLFSDFEIVRLENSDNALVGDGGTWPVWLSEHYLGIDSYEVGAYRLFDRKGKFLRNITTRGQGPNEFLFGIYDSYIDEEEGKIYILPFRTAKIMVFDLSGNALEPIPLPFIVHKGRMKINVKERTLVMLALPFADTPWVVWKQDFDGKIIQSIPAGRFVIDPGDYSNELGVTFNTPDIAYYLLRVVFSEDTLYHYDGNGNALIPAFTMHFTHEPLNHFYTELPGYYIFYPVSYTDDSHLPPVIVDKRTLKGAYVRWQADMLGNIFFERRFSFHQGYASINLHPAELKEKLESALKHPGTLTEEMRQKLTELNNSITDDDNNVVLIGKLKQQEESII